MPSIRVDYLFTWNDFRSSGVPEKVRSQVRTWANQGHSPFLHLVSQNPQAEAWLTSLNSQGVEFETRLYRYQHPMQRLSIVQQVISSMYARGGQILYSRQDFFLPTMWPHRSRIPMVLEVNSDDRSEQQYMGPLRRHYSRATRNLELGLASGIVFVSREIAEGPSFQNVKSPRVVIGNGIDFSRTPDPREAEKEGTRFVFIGTGGQDWHGVDKILQLAAARPQWSFDLIGPPHAEVHRLPRNVRLHGPLAGEEATAILKGAHFALGTLALHRINMSEASPLKVRQYLALGLPVITAHVDTDFPDGAPFLLTLPNAEDNVMQNLPRIDRFVDSWRGKRVPRPNIEHLSTQYKEQARLKFFEEVIELANG